MLLEEKLNDAISAEEELNDVVPNEELHILSDDVQSLQCEAESVEPFQSSQCEEYSYVAVKGVFYTPKADNAGAFCIIYSGENGKVIFRELWAIRSNKEPVTNLVANWEHFIRDMNKIGGYDKESSQKLLPLIVKALNNNIKDYLYNNISETEFAATEIRKAIEKTLHYLVEIKVDAEIFGEERAKKGGVLRDKTITPEQTKNNENRGIMSLIKLYGIPIICDPVIDPVHGSPVSKLKIGDIVHVTIQETNDIAKKVTDLIRAKRGNLAFPVMYMQTMESGNNVALLKISEEISGVLNISPKLMLKINTAGNAENLYNMSFNPISLILPFGVVLFFILLLYLIARLI